MNLSATSLWRNLPCQRLFGKLNWGCAPHTPNALPRPSGGVLEAIRTGSSHGREGFIRFTGFPEREEQYGELSCDGHDGPLLGLGCSLLGKT